MGNTDSINMPKDDYIKYLSKTIAGTKTELQSLMTEVYYLIWKDDFVRFWKEISLVQKDKFPIADRMHTLEGCSEECADKIAAICREANTADRRGQNSYVFGSGKALLRAMQEKEENKKRALSRTFQLLENDTFGKCVEVRYEHADEQEKRRCIRNLDLAGCFKINTVSPVINETYNRLRKTFPLCDKKTWIDLNGHAISVRNFCVGHDTSTQLEETEPEKWREIRHYWEEIARNLLCEKTRIQYDRFCEEVVRGAKKLCYVKVKWTTLTEEAGLSENKCREILGRIYHYESDAEGVFCESKEEALASLSERAKWECIEEENKNLLKRLESLMECNPEMPEEDLEKQAEESIWEEKLKQLPKLNRLASYQGGSVDKEQLRELIKTHIIVLDASVLLSPNGREFIQRSLLPYAVQERRSKEFPPFVVSAQTRYQIYQKYREGDRTAYYFMEDILRKSFGIVRYQGIPNPLCSNEDAMEDFVSTNSLQRMCILTYGSTELPKRIQHKKYPLCLVGRVHKMPLKGSEAELVLFPASLPVEAGRSESRLQERLLQSRRLTENQKNESFMRKIQEDDNRIFNARVGAKEAEPQPQPKVQLVPERRMQGIQVLHTEKGKEIGLTRVLQENGQNAEGGEGTLWETNQPNKVAKIFHKEKRTDARREKLTYMVENPVKLSKVCWPDAVLYDESQTFVGYLMRQVPKGCLQLGTSVLQLLKPVVREKVLSGWNRLDLVRTARSIAETLAKLHERDILMGDINAGNFLVDPQNSSTVYLVDCDSYQVGKYPCPVGKEEYTHPNMASRLGMGGKLEFGNCLRIREEEEYSLAILIFQILMLGEFPFNTRNSRNLAQAMRNREFPYYSREEAKNVPDGPNWMIWKNLPREITDAFSNTFRNWDTLPAKEWEKRLKNYEWMIPNRNFSDELEPRKYHEFHPENPFYKDVVCAVCGEEFNMVKEKAEKLESWKQPFFCPKCFGFLQTLDNMRGEEEFKCERCGRMYKAMARYGYLNEIAGIKFICPDCKNRRKRR